MSRCHAEVSSIPPPTPARAVAAAAGPCEDPRAPSWDSGRATAPTRPLLMACAAFSLACGSDRRARELRDRTVEHVMEQPCLRLVETTRPLGESTFPARDSVVWVAHGSSIVSVNWPRAGEPYGEVSCAD